MADRRRGHGEGSIYRRADARWVGAVDLGWRDGKRQRKVVYGKTRAEVQSALRRVQDRVDTGLTPPRERLTVGAFLNEWAERSLPGTVSERTEDIYRNILRLCLIPALGGVRLAKLTPAQVNGMLREWLDHSHPRQASSG
jgi:integrase